VQALSSILEWYRIEKDPQFVNHAKSLGIKINTPTIELREPFTQQDLRLIFSHPKFAEGRFKYPAYFWIPLVALYSGMRLEEISQLCVKEIYEADGIYVININEHAGPNSPKTLKNINAKRLVPIHTELINLDFIEYHKNCRERESERLFPELNVTKKTHKFGKQVGKQFSDVVKKSLNAKNSSLDRKLFHSLRHTFSNFYKQKGLQDAVFRQLFGHELPELAANTYGSKFQPKKLYDLIKQLNYGIDLSHLKNSRYI
jgi:integrase